MLETIGKFRKLQEIDQDLIAIFNKVSAVVVLQEYARAANNAKKKGISSSLLGIRELLIINKYCYKSQKGNK